jgi:hypothetical protein
MSEFHEGDVIVRKGWGNGYLRLTEGVEYTVISARLVPEARTWVTVTNDIGEVVEAGAENFDLVKSAHESKYDALVADLIAKYRISDATLGAYVKDNLLPKPKQYDVTVRVGETEGRAAQLGSPGSTFRGFPIQSVTEVTE